MYYWCVHFAPVNLVLFNVTNNFKYVQRSDYDRWQDICLLTTLIIQMTFFAAYVIALIIPTQKITPYLRSAWKFLYKLLSIIYGLITSFNDLIIHDTLMSFGVNNQAWVSNCRLCVMQMPKNHTSLLWAIFVFLKVTSGQKGGLFCSVWNNIALVFSVFIKRLFFETKFLTLFKPSFSLLATQHWLKWHLQSREAFFFAACS